MSTVGLLAPAREVGELGAALALSLRGRGAMALLCVWPGAATASGLAGRSHVALPAARRVADGLLESGHAASACGRLAVVELPDAADVAASDARAALLPSELPAVVALGARDEAFDAVLRSCDAVVVWVPGGGRGRLVELACADVGSMAPALALDLRLGWVGRALARHGVAAPRALREAIAPLG